MKIYLVQRVTELSKLSFQQLNEALPLYGCVIRNFLVVIVNLLINNLGIFVLLVTY